MRIGIFGGAFNPPHREHINIVEKLIAERRYDRVIIIPSVNPPHKKSVITPFEHRFNMVKIAFSHIPIVEISDRENRSSKVHYSYDTIRELISEYPEDELEFIIGGDSMIDFHTWYKPYDIARMIRIVVVARGMDDMDIMHREIDTFNGAGGDIVLSDYIAEEVSSSYLRCTLYLHDQDIDLDEEILEYIESNNLYNDYDDILKKLRSTIKPSRYIHTKGVARCAIKINERLRLDFNSVMIATLLHDSAKSTTRYDYSVPLDTIGTNVEHAFMGSEVARYEYGIEDEAILDAIRYHCTARPNMSTLEKLVYSADMLEEGRDYGGVEELRTIMDRDFEEGFLACLNATYLHVKQAGFDMYPLTEEAYVYYNKEKLV